MWIQVTQHYLPMKLTVMQMDDRWGRCISDHWTIAPCGSTVPLASIEAIRTRVPPTTMSAIYMIYLSFLSFLFLFTENWKIRVMRQ